MSQQSTGLSDHEKGGHSSAVTTPARGRPIDFALDHIHRWGKFCNMIGVDRSTAYRWVQKGIGPKVTKLGPGSSGVRHRDYLAWLEARNQGVA